MISDENAFLKQADLKMGSCSRLSFSVIASYAYKQVTFLRVLFQFSHVMGLVFRELEAIAPYIQCGLLAKTVKWRSWLVIKYIYVGFETTQNDFFFNYTDKH